MKISIEQIDELRNRVNVSYEEAKNALEKNEGDLIKAIIELEKKKSKKIERKEHISGSADRFLQIRLSVKSKTGETLLNVSLALALAVFALAFWVVILLFVFAVLTSCKIKIYKEKKPVSVENIKNDMKESVQKIKENTTGFIKENIQADIKDEEENEIIIE